MAEATVEWDERGWDAMAVGPDLIAACVAEAEVGKAFAISISPEETGEYLGSFSVEAELDTYFASGARASAKLINDADHAAAVEFGNEHVRRPHRVLGRTAAFLGQR